MSQSEFAAGDPGYAALHSGSDVGYYRNSCCTILPARNDRVKTDDLISLVDVDYYLTTRKWANLLSKGVPIILYTTVPTSVAGSDEHGSWRFDRNTWIYSAHGGGTYHHSLWNWCVDGFTVPARNWVGLGWRRNVDVHLRTLGHNRALVLLMPRGIYPSFCLGRASPMARTAPLARMRVHEHSPDGAHWSRLAVSTGDQVVLCTAVQGDLAETKLTAELDAAARIMVTSKAAHASTLRELPGAKALTKPDMMRLFKYHQECANIPVQTYTTPIVTYPHPETGEVCEPEPAMIEFMPPILPNKLIPSFDPSSMAASIKTRIKSTATVVEELPLRYQKYVEEFVDLIVDRELQPLSLQEALARLTGQKRQAAERSMWRSTRRKLQAFLKREPVGKKPTRIITPIGPDHSANYATFLAPVEERLKELPWYAFGKAPREVADRVAEVCSQADDVCLTDLSSMDGRITHVVRDIEKRILTRFYDRSHHARIIALQQKTYDRTVVLSDGDRRLEYELGFARASGERGTSCLNTILSALMAYCSYRSRDVPSQPAFNMLGCFGGDDGITPNLPFEAYAETAETFGQRATGSTTPRGGEVSFLARVFSPSVWEGHPESTCDIERTLGQFSFTSRIGVRPLEVAYAKAYALTLSDLQTPIIGEMAQAVHQVGARCGLEEDSIDPRLLGWYARPALKLHVFAGKRFPNAPHVYAERAAERTEVGIDFWQWLGKSHGIRTVQDAEAWLAVAPSAPTQYSRQEAVLDSGLRVEENIVAPEDNPPEAAGRDTPAPEDEPARAQPAIENSPETPKKTDGERQAPAECPGEAKPKRKKTAEQRRSYRSNLKRRRKAAGERPEPPNGDHPPAASSAL
jgi:hypothetical protein